MIMNIRTRQIGALFSEGYSARGPVFLRDRRARREAIFAERLVERLERRLLCWLRVLRPSKLSLIAGELRAALSGGNARPTSLPDPAKAAPGPLGLCGPVTQTNAEVLAEGYARGLHLGAGPAGLRWWSPEQRMAIAPKDFRGASVAASQDAFDLYFDHDFEATLMACERARSTSSQHFLLPPEGRTALCTLADSVFAHSFELRDPSGALVAGGYGVAVGRSFVTQDTFGAPDALQRAMVVLNRHLAHWGFELHENLCAEDASRHGFSPMSRDAMIAVLQVFSGGGSRRRWRVEPTAP
jgi:leucyl/phenylalanyl-tRNA--protein transferase